MKIYAKIRFYWGAFVISTVVAVGMIPLLYIFSQKKKVLIKCKPKVENEKV